MERNCDAMADTLKAVKADMDIKCIMDSGSLMPLAAYNENCAANTAETHSKQALWQPELDETCVAANPDGTNCGA